MGDGLLLLLIFAVPAVVVLVYLGRDLGIWSELRIRRRVKAELRRIGLRRDAIRISVYNADDPGSTNVGLKEVDRPDETSYEWHGRVDPALDRLRGVSDGAGRDALWDAFPDRTRPHGVIGAEIRRIGPAIQYRMQATNDVVLIDWLWAERPQWEWRGEFGEALRRLRDLPGDSGRDDVWSAFAERTPSIELRVHTELERIGSERVFAFHKYWETRTLLLSDTDGESWQGSMDQALERLGGVSSGAGRDAMWEAFPDRASRSSRH